MKLNSIMPTGRQRGAATLVVVMMLFLVMALLAAYANRSLMFEQRIASSYARAGLAQEMAEGGIEWTLAQLNGPAVNAACEPVAAGGQRFFDKYLTIDSADRTINLVREFKNILADCTRNAKDGGWACRCPQITNRVAPAPSSSAEVTPSFGIKLEPSVRGGTFKLVTVGCTDSVVDTCGAGGAGGGKVVQLSKTQHGMARFETLVAFVSAVRNPPAAPLIVKGNLAMTGTGLGLHNTDPRSAGSLLVIGGEWSGMKDDRMQSVPGTSVEQVRIQGDDKLRDASSDVFKMFMGAKATRYAQHPALWKVACSDDCTDALQAAYNAGKRILWIDGQLAIKSNKVIGSVSDPVLIIADGDIELSGPFQLNGMLVTTKDLDWTNDNAQPSLVTGIVLVGGAMVTNGTMDISYQQTIADQLTNRLGSYVRVPGTWIDGK